MSAAQTSLAVLRWAPWADGPPPAGDLQTLESLLQPDADLRQALAQATTVALARLGLPAGGRAGPGAATLLMAAALGAWAHPAAGEVLRLVDVPRHPAGGPVMALHHALVAPALRHLPLALGTELVARSPLTGLLTCPPEGEEDSAVQLAESLAAMPAGRRMLVHRLASPAALPPELRWRAYLLDALRLEPAMQSFVLDVYEAAVALHAPAWKQRIGEALRVLGAAEPDENGLQRADAAGRWWEPFLALYRARHDAVRERLYLDDFELYLAGIRLAQTTLQLRRGTP